MYSLEILSYGLVARGKLWFLVLIQRGLMLSYLHVSRHPCSNKHQKKLYTMDKILTITHKTRYLLLKESA